MSADYHNSVSRIAFPPLHNGVVVTEPNRNLSENQRQNDDRVEMEMNILRFSKIKITSQCHKRSSSKKKFEYAHQCRL